MNSPTATAHRAAISWALTGLAMLTSRSWTLSTSPMIVSTTSALRGRDRRHERLEPQRRHRSHTRHYSKRRLMGADRFA